MSIVPGERQAVRMAEPGVAWNAKSRPDGRNRRVLSPWKSIRLHARRR